MNKDQKLLAEAYNSVLQKKEASDPEWHTDEFYNVLKTLEPGKLYSDKNSNLDPEFNHWVFTSEPGYKRAGIRRLGDQGTRVLTDYRGKQQAGLKEIIGLVPSNMSTEEFKARDNTIQSGITKSVLSQKYSD
jgi:hypothetical protein